MTETALTPKMKLALTLERFKLPKGLIWAEREGTKLFPTHDMETVLTAYLCEDKIRQVGAATMVVTVPVAFTLEDDEATVRKAIFAGLHEMGEALKDPNKIPAVSVPEPPGK